ncbi:DUF362 domain-containing protein [bacterium]|nr:DUF362 domain-containing protein [bacterium]
MKRRDFLLTATGAAMTVGMTGRVFAQTAAKRDVSYEPDRPLESTGLTIRDGVKILKKGEKNNTAPVLREEILDNPGAVFIIYAGINTDQDAKGSWKPCPDQMERFGNRAAGLVFRKGAVKGGRTFIKPNLVGGLGKDSPVENSHGGIVHPYFIVGFVDTLRDMGNSNVAIGARGALRHPQVVESGFEALLDKHNLPLIEAHVQYFKHYKKDELVWHENPEGMVQRRFCTYKPVYLDGTTFINIAHAHTHKVGHTTLTLKNIQGVMPRGYGHICDAWSTLDIWRRDLMGDFNGGFRRAVEYSYLTHAGMGYKYWDDGDFYRSYKAAGGYDAFREARRKYGKTSGDDRQKALDSLIDIADTRLFWAEMWAQRMMDINEALPSPYVNMVEGVFARGDDIGVVHADFLTVGRSSVAVDAVTSWLMGQDPRELPYLRIANERGLGQNDIEKIPIYILSEKGVEKVTDYRSLKRSSLGIYNYGLRDLGPRYF